MATSAEYNLGEYEFPRGWFVVANSSQIVPGKPYNARYFGQDVVIFRTADGEIGMLEAYCPHMGTHFGTSTTAYIAKAGLNVQGNGIRCPFHGWRFGTDGKCNHIPYYDGNIPEAAQVKSWPTAERWGVVFCWNDPEGGAPDFALPDFPEWDDPAYVRWEGLDHMADLPIHPIEVFDNNSDYAHLNYLHGSEVQYYENEVDGVYYRQRQSTRGSRSDTGPEWELNPGVTSSLTETDHHSVSTVNAYHGVGLNAARFAEIGAAELIGATPIENGSCRVWQGAIVRAPGGVVDDEARAFARRINDMFSAGLGVHDGEVWATKRAATRIMQLPTDGPFGQARIWYSQFFNPRSKADQIVARVAGVHRVKGVPGAPEGLA
jgi:3-ketosteroid 9alpha-monooxygenase subunit A